jgi:hypothetical protein
VRGAASGRPLSLRFAILGAMRIRVACLLGAVLVLAGCGSSTETIPESKLSRLVLERGDLPPGFAPFYVGKLLRSDQTSRRSDPERFGRHGGWIGRYHRGGSPKTSGPLVVSSRVDLFDDSGGAKDDLGLYADDFKTAGGRRVETADLGDESVGVTALQGAGATEVRSYAIAWRRANATASVEANGFAKRFTLAQALALARKQDARLRAAAG